MNYSQAIFIIRTELDTVYVSLEKNDNGETPPVQFPVSRDIELDWFDFAKVNDFDLSDLNVEIISIVRCSNATVEIQHSIIEIKDNKEDGNIASRSVNHNESLNASA